jgi:hypothetical protein
MAILGKFSSEKSKREGRREVSGINKACSVKEGVEERMVGLFDA